MIELGNIGQSGRVVTTIRKGQIGEVSLPLPNGGTQGYPARAFDPEEEIAAGKIIWVEEQYGNMVYVVTR